MKSLYKILILRILLISLAHIKCIQGTLINNGTSSTEQEVLKLEEETQQVLGRCSKYLLVNDYVRLENGSLLLPGSDSIYNYQEYFIQNNTAFLCSEEEKDETLDHLAYNFSEEFLSCSHVVIDPDEYSVLKNGSIYIDVYSQVYGPRDFYMQEYGVYVCLPSYEEMHYNTSANSSHEGHKFSESFTYVTYVGLTLSVISLLSHLVIFCFVPSVRNLPGYCLASLSLSLLVAYLCFLAVDLMQTTDHCANLGLSIYYFFLSSFFWINAIAFDIWRSFRVVVRELRISSHRVPWRRFLLYSIYSWLVPAAFTILVRTADTTDLLPEEYKPAFGAPLCWFSGRKALLVFFAGPLIVVMSLNSFFFLDVAYVISRASLRTSRSHKAILKKRFFMFMRLSLIMGLTWVVGLIAGYADSQFMWYLFIILNTLQGLFIFVVFSCSSKVKGFCCKKNRKKPSKGTGNISMRTTSQFSSAA